MTGDSPPPGDDELLVGRNGCAATLWLNRPTKRNAVTYEMWQGITATCAELAADGDVRVLVVRGVGEHFCAGADVSGLVSVDPVAYATANEAASTALARFPKPTIAAISGSCVGGGAQLALACDVRVADDTSLFGITPARLGIVYPGFALDRAVRLLGPTVVKQLIYTAELVDARTALHMGLVGEVQPRDRLDTRVDELVDAICHRSALTQHAAKEMVESIVAGGALDPALTARWTQLAETSGERDEGLSAFIERREPAFGWRP